MAILLPATVVGIGVAVFLGWPEAAMPMRSTWLMTTFTVAALIGLTVSTLYAIWRARLETLARRPGPILVLPTVDRAGETETPTVDSARARWLTGEFRRRLSDTKLYRSTATPSSGTSSEFLDVVEQAGDSFSVFWSPVVRLLRLLCPVSAYQVRCELLPQRDPKKPAVVQVELLRLPVSSVAPVLVEEDTWERAMERAAHHVAAVILPRTRQCRIPPWTTWQDLRLPSDLFDLVQRFETQRIERRYDEAQATMREALVVDPGNLALRLELGKLQEKMDMHLDALLTYDDVIGRASRTNDELSSWWNHMPGEDEPWSDETPGRIPGLPASDPVVHVARYRHALLLGLGDKLAAQWWDRPLGCPAKVHRGARVQRRDYLRRILSDRFAVRYADIVSSLKADGLVRGSAEEYLSRRDGTRAEPESGRGEAGSDLRIFFTTVGVVEFERLVDEDERGRRSRAGRARRLVLPRRALELALYSSCLRRGMAFADAARVDRFGFPAVRRSQRSVRDPEQWTGAGGTARIRTWPPPAAAVHTSVNEIVDAHRTPLRSWLEHYNAACVYALSMLPTDPFTAAEMDSSRFPEQERSNERRLARLAVGELAKAVRCPDIGPLALQRDWVLNEDPAFDRLRAFRAFRDFEAQTFGSVGRAYQRGPRMGVWQQTAHVADIVTVSGREAAKLWAERAVLVRRKPQSRAELQRWLREEREGWRLAEVLAVDNRDWASRHRVARRVGDWAEDVGLDLSRQPHPTYSEALLALQLSSMDGATEAVPIDPDARPRQTIAMSLREAMIRCDKRLDALARDLRPSPPVPATCCRRGLDLVLGPEWNDLTRQFADEAPDPAPRVVEAWCERSRDRWQALAAWFDDRTLGAGELTDRRARFRRALTPVRSPEAPSRGPRSENGTTPEAVLGR